jgi:hypothetical protein
MPQQSILDARLAEIDRRLRTIQSELLTTGGPAAAGSESPVAEGAPPAPAAVPPAEGAPPAPAAVPPAAAPVPPLRAVAPSPPPGLQDELGEAMRLVAQLRELTAAHERLLASAHELLTTFADAFAAMQAGRAELVERPAGAGAAPVDAPAVPGPPPPVSVTAGPFADTAALRQFEHALLALPDVHHVAVREYAGTDRVVVDVHLSGSTS